VLLGLVHLERNDLEQGAEQLVRAADERPEDAEAQVLAALAAAAAGWEDAAQQTIARVEYAAESYDEEMLEEARDRIDEDREAALEFLTETVAPVALRDRLTQPL
jgi:hypothetical protein